MHIREFQENIRQIYHDKDSARGLAGTFVWFIEEIGELARALHRSSDEELAKEFADCMAWLATLANLRGIALEDAVKKYGGGCPRCQRTPCGCPEPKSIGTQL